MLQSDVSARVSRIIKRIPKNLIKKVVPCGPEEIVDGTTEKGSRRNFGSFGRAPIG